MSIVQAIGLSVLPNLGGIAGSYFTRKSIKTWYESLDKPSWRPPNRLFAPVWTTLYSSIGYASFLILRDGVGSSRNLALGLYGTQLALNWAWTPLFFHYHKLGLATVEIGLLTANIAACIYAFYPINKTAAYLLLPYLAWVSFASALTYNIWKQKERFSREHLMLSHECEFSPGTQQTDHLEYSRSSADQDLPLSNEMRS
ncbi:unnamed protein product [Brachionus calyciflorus]|uniref:Translocator protein n=1 Tax=Brachionus calyciflorus TaxID=104777 RepID=A0A813W6R4_9BILA|nr:unnamed protein product [Brachionus calyciflorus]